MLVKNLHGWNIGRKEAIKLQQTLSQRLVERPLDIGTVHLVAGVDLSANRNSRFVYAAAVVVKLSDMSVVDSATSVQEIDYPYIPGLLSFREGPATLDALSKLKTSPDAVIFDGQGYAHPRRLGLAAHIGLWLEVPTAGCAKTRLLGDFVPPSSRRGGRSPLVHKGETVGSVLTTRDGVKPVFVSRGNRIDLESAIDLVLAATGGFRLPEPIRYAHKLCNELRKERETRY